MPWLFATRLAPLVAATVAVSACGVGVSPRRATAPVEAPATTLPAEEVVSMSVSETDVDPLGLNVPDADLRQRCIDTIRILDRRIDTEGFEYPDEEPELTEEELEQTMAPEIEFVDGVAAPGDRPAIEPMGVFDPETAPIPDLDHFRESCFEQGLVTEEELYGPDGGDDDDGDDWCEELAGIPIEEVQEFAAEEGEDVVREEFAACGLPDPLDA